MVQSPRHVHRFHLTHRVAPVQDLVDRLTHIIPNGDLTGHHLDFASAYVRHALAERFIKTKQTDLRGFLLAYEPSGSKYSVLWGHMFEFYALSMLAAANSFKQRNMTTGKPPCCSHNLWAVLSASPDIIGHDIGCCSCRSCYA